MKDKTYIGVQKSITYGFMFVVGIVVLFLLFKQEYLLALICVLFGLGFSLIYTAMDRKDKRINPI